MKHSLSSDLVVIAELHVNSSKREEFLDYVVANLEYSRSHPGNKEFNILIDEATPEIIKFYEVWKSREAQQTYMTSRVEAGDLTTLLSFLMTEPKFTAHRRIAT